MNDAVASIASLVFAIIAFILVLTMNMTGLVILSAIAVFWCLLP